MGLQIKALVLNFTFILFLLALIDEYILFVLQSNLIGALITSVILFCLH